uniref:Uncharacterized protein n=1 Tax=Arundo donax TaxID=35708 RepID=A0A0A9GN65_ARUDO
MNRILKTLIVSLWKINQPVFSALFKVWQCPMHFETSVLIRRNI